MDTLYAIKNSIIIHFIANKKVFLLGSLFDISGALVGGLVAGILQMLLDSALHIKENLTFCIVSLALFAIFIILNQVFTSCSNYFSEIEEICSKAKLEEKFHEKISKLGCIAFENSNVLKEIELARTGIDGINALATCFKIICTFYLPYLIVVSIYLFILKPSLAVAIAFIFIPSIISHILRTKLFVNNEDNIVSLKRQMDSYKDAVMGKETLKETRTLGRISFFRELFCKVMNSYQNGKYKLDSNQCKVFCILDIIKVCGYVCVILMAFYATIKQEISFGAFVSILSVIGTLFNLMNELISRQIGGIAREFGTAIHFYRFVNKSYDNEGSKNISFTELPDNAVIELNDVSFSYPNSEISTLKNINLQIKQGDIVAIVGENGSGKSTLVKILSGLYSPTNGTILLDSHKWDQNQPFISCSAVFQNFCKYHLSLKENISIGQSDEVISTEKLNRVSKFAEIDLKLYPNEYNTILSREFGLMEPSIGQWQRIAIARGIYRNAHCLFLDEPTSSLDPFEEAKILQKFMDASKGKTTFIVTHRISSAKRANKIIVLQNGRIIESGSHDQLYNSQTQYSRLYNLQKQMYTEI